MLMPGVLFALSQGNEFESSRIRVRTSYLIEALTLTFSFTLDNTYNYSQVEKKWKKWSKYV